MEGCTSVSGYCPTLNLTAHDMHIPPPHRRKRIMEGLISGDKDFMAQVGGGGHCHLLHFLSV